MSASSAKIPTLTDNKDEKHECKLIKKFIISPDTRKFRFGLPSPQHVLGLPPGQHIYLIAQVNDSPVIRPYSPVSDDDDLGYFDVIIKVYKKGIHPKFPDGGKLSQHLESMNIGDAITMKGPVGYMLYKGLGEFHLKKALTSPGYEIVKKYNKLGMIAGGTGITPMLQIATYILKNPNDHTTISLLFSNHTEDDVLCKDEIDNLVKQYPGRFKAWYTLTHPDKKPSAAWKYSNGRVTAETIKEHMPAPAPGQTYIILCGPPGFLKEACHPALDTLGYDKEDRYG